MEAATERCEAYKPSSTQDKDDKYWQRGAPLPLLSKLQLSLQEDGPRPLLQWLDQGRIPPSCVPPPGCAGQAMGRASQAARRQEGTG